MPVTVELLLYSQFMALIVAVPLGILAAKRAGGLLDRVSTTVLFGAAVGAELHARPGAHPDLPGEARMVPAATGYTDFADDPLKSLGSLFLPALTLAVAEMAVYIRLLRTDLIATLQEDYIMMAKAKGLPLVGSCCATPSGPRPSR